MNGKEILVDTNIILYLLNGDDTLVEFLQGKTVYISFVTELELIGFNGNPTEESQIKAILDDCLTIAMNDSIKGQYAFIRKNYKLKLADAIIAATSLAYDLPLITADLGFKAINDTLKLITYTPGIILARKRDN